VALKPAGKTLSSLTGIVVLAAVLWALLNFVYAPSCGRFSCSYVPSWWPQAQADTIAGSCPDGLRGAATDAGWAADRIASISDEKVTTMLAYDQDGAEHRFASAEDANAEKVVKVLEELKYEPDRTGRYPAASHAEPKLAYWMRTAGVTSVVAVINNDEGVCKRGEQACTAIIRAMLPRGSTLLVWYPGASKPTELTGGS
jgi:nucleic acid/nucleotide deaminase of polymorphic system toxin